MKIKIPKRLKEELSLVASVRMEFDREEDPSAELDILVPLLQIEKMDFVNFPDQHWQNCSFVRYKVKYNDGSEEVFDFDNKQSARFFSELGKAVFACLRTNKESSYKDNVTGRKDCLAAIDSLIASSSKISTQPTGNKTLVYYTVYFNKGYIELFNLSVKSLLSNSKKDFDILVITDEATKELLEKTEAARLKKLKYFVTDTPIDGVDASKMKVDVYRYADILDYGKVLFLDCDIVAQSNIDELLSLELDAGVLYTAKNKNLGFHSFKTTHHGFTCLSDEFVEEMRLGDQYPFNAGQYMFAPSQAMLKHFENVRWFMDNWPSEYFFEQCFMNYYFCRAYSTDITKLKKYIGLNSTIDTSIIDDDIASKALVHFIAPPLDAAKKLEYITNYLQARKKPNFLSKIGNIFKRKNE